MWNPQIQRVNYTPHFSLFPQISTPLPSSSLSANDLAVSCHWENRCTLKITSTHSHPHVYPPSTHAYGFCHPSCHWRWSVLWRNCLLSLLRYQIFPVLFPSACKHLHSSHLCYKTLTWLFILLQPRPHFSAPLYKIPSQKRFSTLPGSMSSLQFHLDPLQSCFHPTSHGRLCQGHGWPACAKSNDPFPWANSSFWHSWLFLPPWCSFLIWLPTFALFPSYLIDGSCSVSSSGSLSSPCLLKLEGYRASFLVSSYLFSG